MPSIPSAPVEPVATLRAPVESIEWAELRHKQKEFKFQVVVQLVSLLGIAAGACWVGYKYFDDRTKEQELRNREVNLKLFQEKKEAYTALVNAATAVSLAANQEKAKGCAPDFFAAYLGRVHLVPALDEEVAEKKKDFARKLRLYLIQDPAVGPPEDFLKPELEALDKACQQGCQHCLDVETHRPAAAPAGP